MKLLIAILILLVMSFITIDSVLNQIDVRVCSTATPAQYQTLHCDEVMK